MGEPTFKILVCRGPECGERRDAQSVFEEFRRVADGHPIGQRLELGRWSCFGRCTQGPNVLVQKKAEDAPGQRRFVLATMPSKRGGRSVLYNGVSSDDVLEILKQHVLGNEPVRRLIRAPRRTAGKS